MYSIRSITIDEYRNLPDVNGQTVFTTVEWISFLIKNQKASPIILELCIEANVIAYFVGLVVNKFGIRILGSPFKGWLTPDMGFVKVADFDHVKAIQDVAAYAFKTLHCMYFQITDKELSCDEVEGKLYYEKTNLLQINLEKPQEEMLESFTKNGRRDVRAALRKDTEYKTVPFDKEFVRVHYSQLEDVFAKQNLKPFYSIQKLYDLAEAFEDKPENIVALAAYSEGKCVASVFSVGYGEWAYYMGAASFREYQKLLPNEGLFWNFVEYWYDKGIKRLDLVGYREYKMKYNPEVSVIPTVIIAKYRVLIYAKKLAEGLIRLSRKIKGKLASIQKKG